MDELEPLATALKHELGSPPEAWLREQRARVRSLPAPPRRRPWLLAVPAAIACVGLVAGIVWFNATDQPQPRADSWLDAAELRGPYRLEDGSSIALRPEARGRLSVDADSVRFDLHHGRATFDVVPNRTRQFIITAGKNEVRVVGTRFSVLYGPAETFEVDVERGVVAVRVPDRKASVQLEAGGQLRGGPARVELVEGSAKEQSPPLALDVGTPAPAAASASPPAKTDWQAPYRQGKYAEALTLLRASGLDTRLNELSPSTLAELADVARLGGDPDLAVRALTVLLRRFPASAEARDGKFLLGRVQALRGDGAAAIATFESYLQNGESARYANEAIGRLMELYSARGDTERARVMAERYLARAPSGPYQRLARSLVGERK